MRILSFVFIVVAGLFAALLVTHSIWLFGLYVAAASVSLLLMWFWRAREAPVATVSSEHQAANNEQPKTSERRLETATDDPATGIPPTKAPPSPAAINRRFWIRLLVVLLSPLLTFLIVGVVIQLESRLPEFVPMMAFLLIPATWIVLVWGLASLSKILLFGRAQTQFPPWSMLVGVLTTFGLILCALSPFGLLAMSGGCAMSREVRIPPNAFDVRQRIEFRLEGSNPVSEEYHIEPKKHYAIESVSEVESGLIKSAQIEMFESGKFQDQPLKTLQLEGKRTLSAETQSLGWFRSKITFKPPDVRLIVKDMRVYADNEGTDTISKLEEFPASRATNFQSAIEIELPKNAFLASLPQGELTTLPDKDVLRISLSKHEPVELYYLRRARFRMVANMLGQSSNHDLLTAALAFAFWPSALILIGKFHQKLADRIVGVVSVVFRKKPKVRTAGFTSSGK